MAIIRIEDLPAIRKRHGNQRVLFCSGCFDLTHAGHALFFEDCKKLGDILVVMVGSDAALTRDKGPERPILNEHVRLKMVDSLKPVDYAFLNHLLPAASDPLDSVALAIEKLKPDTYIINRDARNIPRRENFSKKHGVSLVVLERTAPPEFEEISTSGIIKKIRSANSA